MSVPTLPPSSRITPWEVGPAIVVNSFTTFDGVLQLSNGIGAEADNATASLFNKGCTTEQPDASAIFINSSPFVGDVINYNVTFASENFGSDPGGFVSFNETEFGGQVRGVVEFCIRVTSYESTLGVSFMESDYSISFDFTTNSFIMENIEIEEEEQQNVSDIVASGYSVEACQANALMECETSTVQQDTSLRVVLFITSESDQEDAVLDVEISNFDFRVFAGTVEYIPIEIGSTGWVDNPITLVEPFVDERGNCVFVETLLIVDFFTEGFDEVSVDGNAFLSFVGLRRDDTPILDEYSLVVGLNEHVAKGCVESIFQSLKLMF